MEEQKQPNKINLLNQDDIKSDIKQDFPEIPKKTGLPTWLIILIAVLVIAIIGIGSYFVYSYYFNSEKPVACTEEAKVCPDGSSVSRIAPDCEFAECIEVVDSTADWQTYRNEEYGFEMKYSESWRFNEYDLSKVTSGEIHQFQFAGDGQMSDFSIYIWDFSAENSQIISNNFIGFEFREENNVSISNKPATELVYYGPSNILGGMHTYRLYIIRTGKYAYVLHGSLCMDEKISECNQILSTFKFIE